MTDKLVERALLRFVAECSDEEQMLPAFQFIANRSDLIADAITKALASSVPEQDRWQAIEVERVIRPADGSTLPHAEGWRIVRSIDPDGPEPKLLWQRIPPRAPRLLCYLNPTDWTILPPSPPPAVSGLQDSQQGSGADAARQPALVASLPEPLSGVSARPGDGQAQDGER